MSIEALFLGALSAGRATPLAVVYGLLLSREPRRLLAAYIVAGMLVSLTVGIAIVMFFQDTTASSTSTAGRYVIDLVVGIGALSYSAGFWSGRVGSSPRTSSATEKVRQRLRNPTLLLAAGAGAATNLPGLFYIAGLVAILQTHPSPTNAVVQVVVYNILRFAAPVAAFVLVITRPERVRGWTDAVYEFGRRHSREIIVLLFGAVGVYLIVKGLSGLL